MAVVVPLDLAVDSMVNNLDVEDNCLGPSMGGHIAHKDGRDEGSNFWNQFLRMILMMMGSPKEWRVALIEKLRSRSVSLYIFNEV